MGHGFRAAVLACLLGAAPCVARADVVVYTAHLDGAGEAPPNTSPGTGFAVVTVDTTAGTMRVVVSFSGLLGTTTAAHIHAATALPGAGTAVVATTIPTFPNFPLGVTSGSYDQTFDMAQTSSYNPAFITAHGNTTASAEAFLLASLADGTSYLNIHTGVVPGGEIRGFLQAVPEPSSLVLLGCCGLGFAATRWYRARRSG